MRILKNNSLKILFFFLLIFLDQFSKYLIRSQGGFYVCNKGIAFGFELHLIFFWIIWLAIFAITGFQIFNFQSIFNQFSINKFLNFKIFGLLLIFSGGISNTIDRLRFGCVIDFIDLKFWPIFNLADVFIVAGVIMLIIANLKFQSSK